MQNAREVEPRGRSSTCRTVESRGRPKDLSIRLKAALLLVLAGHDLLEALGGPDRDHDSLRVLLVDLDRLAQGVHFELAVAAQFQMGLDLATQFGALVGIEILGELVQYFGTIHDQPLLRPTKTFRPRRIGLSERVRPRSA